MLGGLRSTFPQLQVSFLLLLLPLLLPLLLQRLNRCAHGRHHFRDLVLAWILETLCSNVSLLVTLPARLDEDEDEDE